MKKSIIGILASCFLFANITAFAFEDMKSSDSVTASAVEDLAQLGVINGYEDGTFRPENSISRAEIVQIAANVLPKTVNSGITMISFRGSDIYTDLNDSYWADNAIGRMTLVGYIDGYEDKSFKPDNRITYSEAIKIIVSMLNYGETAKNSGGYPDGYLKTAAELKITDGLEFSPEEEASRGDIAIMFERMIDVPHLVMTSYTVGAGGEYRTDNELTYRNMILAVNK